MNGPPTVKSEFGVLCVCSDATVGKRNTNEDLRISEAPFDVTSDPDVIRAFLKLQPAQGDILHISVI